MTTAQTIVQDAYIASGMKSPGEAVSALEYQYGLSRLNGVCQADSAFQTSSVLTQISASLVSGEVFYTIEPGGDINSSTPHGIEHAFFRIGGTDYELDLLSADDYWSDLLKTQSQNIPTGVYYDNGRLYMLPQLSAAATIYLICRIPRYWDAIDTDVTLAIAEQDAIYLTLAERLCVGVKAVSKDLALAASNARRAFRNANMRIKDLNIGGRSGFDIISGRYL